MKCGGRNSTLGGRNRKDICPTYPSPGLSPQLLSRKKVDEPLEGQSMQMSTVPGPGQLAQEWEMLDWVWGNILIHSRIRDAFISSFICFVFIELVSCFEAQGSLALHCFSASAPSTEIIGLCVPHPDIPMSPVSAVCKPQHSRLLYSAQLSSSSTGIALPDFRLTSTRSTHSGPAPPPVCPVTLLSRFFHRKPFTF